MESPRAIETMAILTKVWENFPLFPEASLVARKNSVFNEKKSLFCKLSPILSIMTGRVICLILALVPFFGFSQEIAKVINGASRTTLYYPAIKGKKVAVVVNAASVSDGKNIVDQLVADKIDVKRIFSPEHGFRMNSEAGESVNSSVDSLTGIEIVSLYGNSRKPSPSSLAGVEVVVFDLQDAGVRFFTYISTLSLVMEACAESRIPLIVLDRPNPNAGYVDGPVLEKKFASFVGMHPVPVVYGMTIGEYSAMVNGEHWLPGNLTCNLKVVPLANYKRDKKLMPVVKPSPNLPTLNAIQLYPSLCLFEGTEISVGRGTPYPFEVYGHPLLKSGSFSFTPQPVAGMSMNPPQKGKICYGEDLRDYLSLHPGQSNHLILKWLMETYRELGKGKAFFNDYFNRLSGNSELQEQIIKGVNEKKIRASWKPGIDKFLKTRKKYLLYP